MRKLRHKSLNCRWQFISRLRVGRGYGQGAGFDVGKFITHPSDVVDLLHDFGGQIQYLLARLRNAG